MKSFYESKDTGNKGSHTRYFNPSTLIQPKSAKNKNNFSKIHCRSMEELDINPNIAFHSSINKEQVKNNVHHSSLFSQKQNVHLESQPSKSRSLSKFIALFQNSNILNTKYQNVENKNEKNLGNKKKNYNGFTYDMKIGLNNSENNKKILMKKQNIGTFQTINSSRSSNRQLVNKSTILSNKQIQNEKNHKIQNQNLIKNRQKNEESLLIKMKQIIEQQKKRQTQQISKIQTLQQKNKIQQNELNTSLVKIQSLQKLTLRYKNQIEKYDKTFYEIQKQSQTYQNQIRNYKLQIQNYKKVNFEKNQKEAKLQKYVNDLELKNKQFQLKVKQFQQKIKNINQKETKNGSKFSKQHDLVIKSLKKVINEQLNKIIQLQQYKIQNEILHQKFNNIDQQNQTHQNQQNKQQFESFQQNLIEEENVLIAQESNDLQNIEKLAFTNNEKDNQQKNNFVKDKRKYEFQKENKRKQFVSSIKRDQVVKQNESIKNKGIDKKNKKNSSVSFQICSQRRKKSNLRNGSRMQNTQNQNVYYYERQEMRCQKVTGHRVRQTTESNESKQRSKMIKVREDQNQLCQEIIQEVTEQNQQNEMDANDDIQYEQGKVKIRNMLTQQKGSQEEYLREQQDSILEEVDQYLSKWRHKF